MGKETIAWTVGIVLVVAGIAGYFLWMTPSSAPQEQLPADQSGEPQAQVPAQPQVTAENSTDTALDEDAAKIDAELKVLDGDTSKVDSGMQDKPVAQDY